MEKKPEHRKRGIRFIIIFLLIFGTGLFQILLWKKNQKIDVLQEKIYQNIVEIGFSQVECLQAAEAGNGTDMSWDFLVARIPAVAYLVQGGDSLEQRAKEEIQGMAALYPGKNHSAVLWSGAGNDKAVESQLFQNLDENILLADQEKAVQAQAEKSAEQGDEEDQGLEQAARKENEAAMTRQQEKKEDEKATVSITQGLEGISENLKKIKRLESSLETNFLIKNFYIVDSSTSIDNKVFDVEKLLNTNLSMKKKNEPQILIYHTHGASESFRDSRAGNKEDSIIGVGSYLADILEKKYGYQVIHDETEYDKIQGKIDRNKAYNKSYAGLTKHLKENPQIQVVIDLHRDGVGNNVQRTTTINGEKTAQVMFFNGLSRNRKGSISYLKNDNLSENLAFSLQMKLKCMENYPDFAKPVYLKSYRYNLHMRKRSLLVELGNENNTLEEAKNAMEPLAEVLNQVLSGN